MTSESSAALVAAFITTSIEAGKVPVAGTAAAGAVHMQLAQYPAADHRHRCYSTYVQGLADARKRAHRSGLVQFFAVYQFDRGGILQMCHTVGELCNHAVRGSMVWRQTSDTIEFCILITCCILITA